MVLALSACLALGCGDTAGAPVDAGWTCTTAAQCEDGLFCNGVAMCAPSDPSADENGCVERAPLCTGSQTCDEATRRCLDLCGADTDADGDGHESIACGGDDCDDTNADRFPANPERCDSVGLDEDCDPTTLGDDEDADGFVDARCCNRQADGGLACGQDCSDDDDEVKPNAPEICNLRDDNCDGEVDEGLEAVAYFPDCDGDLFGFDAGLGLSACTQPGSPPVVCAGRPSAGWSDRATDCDDGSALVNPNRTELCAGGVDDDCDGELHPSEDADGDGWINAACGGTDCDDSDEDTFLGAPELCDRRDNDCDGSAAGEDLDADDELGVAASCVGGALAGLPQSDCDDANALVASALVELCDGVDNNCDEEADELPAASDACPSDEYQCLRGECLRCASCDFSGEDQTYWYVLSGLSATQDDGLDLDDGPSAAGCGSDLVAPDGRTNVDNVIGSFVEVAVSSLGVEVETSLESSIEASELVRLLALRGVDGCNDPEVTLELWEARVPVGFGALILEFGEIAPGQRVDLVGALPLGSLAGEIDGGRLRLRDGYFQFALDSATYSADTQLLFGPPHVGARLEACAASNRLAGGVLGGVVEAELWIDHIVGITEGIISESTVRALASNLIDIDLDGVLDDPVRCEAVSTAFYIEAVSAVPGVRWAD